MVKNYVKAVRQSCFNVVSQLLGFNNKLDLVKVAYDAEDSKVTSFVSDIKNSFANARESAAERREEFVNNLKQSFSSSSNTTNDKSNANTQKTSTQPKSTQPVQTPTKTVSNSGSYTKYQNLNKDDLRILGYCCYQDQGNAGAAW